MKKIKQLSIMLVLVVLLAGVIGVGITGAQEDGETSAEASAPLSWLDVAAEAIGIEAEALIEALDDGQTIAEVAEANGVDIQIVIDALVTFQSEALVEAATSFIEQPMLGKNRWTFGSGLMGMRVQSFGHRPGSGMMGRMDVEIMPFFDFFDGDFQSEWGGGMGRMHMPPFEIFEFGWSEARPPMMGMMDFGFDDGCLAAVAEAVGIEQETLTDALADGQTLAELAEANGVAVETVIEAVEAVITEHIDAGIESGRLSESQAELMREHVAEMVEQFVNEGFPVFGFGSFDVMPMRGRGRGGRGGSHHHH